MYDTYLLTYVHALYQVTAYALTIYHTSYISHYIIHFPVLSKSGTIQAFIKDIFV